MEPLTEESCVFLVLRHAKSLLGSGLQCPLRVIMSSRIFTLFMLYFTLFRPYGIIGLRAILPLNLRGYPSLCSARGSKLPRRQLGSLPSQPFDLGLIRVPWDCS